MRQREETLYTARAGLIIAAPFLPQLFERLGYLIERLDMDPGPAR